MVVRILKYNEQRRKYVGVVVPSEHQEQVTLFARIRVLLAVYPELGKLFAVPNGTRTTPFIASKMKAEGVKRGVPDLFYPEARGGYFGLFIEMKARPYRNAAGALIRQSLEPDQKKWQRLLTESGFLCIKAEGAEDALDQLLTYNNLPKTERG